MAWSDHCYGGSTGAGPPGNGWGGVFAAWVGGVFIRAFWRVGWSSSEPSVLFGSLNKPLGLHGGLPPSLPVFGGSSHKPLGLVGRLLPRLSGDLSALVWGGLSLRCCVRA